MEMQERERLEAELAETRKQLEEAQQIAKEALEINEEALNQRDAALARAERAEGELEVALHQIDVLNQRWNGCAGERDESLALVETLRGALEKMRKDQRLWKRGGAGGQDKYAGLPPAMRVIDDALSVAPPQALAQQRERMEKALRVVDALRPIVKAYAIEHESLRQSRSRFARVKGIKWTVLVEALAAFDRGQE